MRFGIYYRQKRPQEKSMKIKQIIKSIPVVGSIISCFYRKWITSPQPFVGSGQYWNERYECGRNSGDGSYNHLAEFKAEILNTFVVENEIKTVIEYGCGDGNQLGLARYPSYVGFDVSAAALSMCKDNFINDESKAFKLMDDYDSETAELTLSLDVIYHLVEDNVFAEYMDKLFDSSTRFVIVYSSNTKNNPEGQSTHVRHRKFSEWIEINKINYKLIKHIPNVYPFDGNTKTGSFADFYIYEKV